jgi:hypothetical protein
MDWNIAGTLWVDVTESRGRNHQHNASKAAMSDHGAYV